MNMQLDKAKIMNTQNNREKNKSRLYFNASRSITGMENIIRQNILDSQSKKTFYVNLRGVKKEKENIFFIEMNVCMGTRYT